MEEGRITPRGRNGQGLMEYIILILIVIAALIAMTLYIGRSVNARLKATQRELFYHSSEK